MPDQFEELFTRARPVAVQTIRPPGADAARTTVRRRRRRRAAMVTASAVVLAVLGGGTFLRMTPPPAVPVVPADLGKVARNALGPVAGPAAVERNGEVRNDWSAESPPYLGEQTLVATCAGVGMMTLSVTGVPSKESGSTAPVPVSDLKVPCSLDPVPVSTRYLTGFGLVGVEYTIVDAASSQGRAAFAFRVLTLDTGEPLTGASDRGNPTAALHLTEKESNSQFGMGTSLEPNGVYLDDLPAWIGGRFKVAAACAGIGKLMVTIERPDQTIIDQWKLPCQWPPKRYDWTPDRGSGALRLEVVFLADSKSEDGANFAVQFDPN